MNGTATTASPTPVASVHPRHSWLAQVTLRALGGWSARAGLVWVIVVAVGAVFAPFIANTDPILLKTAGRWSSPMLAHLTRVDVLLLVAGLMVTPYLFFSRQLPWQRLARASAIMLVTLVLCLIFIRPRDAIDYQYYRDLERQGRVEYILRTVIPYSPEDRMRDQFNVDRPHPWPPSHGHWLGTDVNGSDILAGMIHSCRIAMSVGFISTGIAAIIGIIIGGSMGYFVSWVDLLGMRLVEVFGAIPTFFLLLAVVAAWGPNLYLIMVIIGMTSWVGDARFVRAEFLKLRQQDFVQAAIAAGLPLPVVLFKHILPNALAPLLVSVSFGVASGILLESSLSFLGFGPVGQPSWGTLLNQAVSAGGGFTWWLAVFPGLAIFLTVFAYNLVGESLRDALDPRLQAKRA